MGASSALFLKAAASELLCFVRQMTLLQTLAVLCRLDHSCSQLYYTIVAWPCYDTSQIKKQSKRAASTYGLIDLPIRRGTEGDLTRFQGRFHSYTSLRTDL